VTRSAIIGLLIIAFVAGGVAAGQSAEASGGCGPNVIVCPPEEPTTEGDQGTGSVVTEGVQFPGVSADSALGKATAAHANCSGCEWVISPACMANAAGDSAACVGATIACAEADAIQYRVYFRPSATAAWQLIDSICLGPTERPASVADVGELVRERVVTLLPDAEPSFQPRDGGIVNLPTIFAAGEPGTIEPAPFDVLGFTVEVTATARWEWTFEPGTTQEFTVAGGAYPDDSVSHTYARPGGRNVTVTTYWAAEFTVDGQGPFAVPGPEISKTAGPIAVPVREASSQLVGG
jgi:hypothetical protein